MKHGKRVQWRSSYFKVSICSFWAVTEIEILSVLPLKIVLRLYDSKTHLVDRSEVKYSIVHFQDLSAIFQTVRKYIHFEDIDYIFYCYLLLRKPSQSGLFQR